MEMDHMGPSPMEYLSRPFSQDPPTKMAVSNPTRRFDVRMPPDLAQDMQDLEQETGLSRGEIFRRAMALYKSAKQTQSARGNVILRDSDGTIREVIGI
ncbi:CopG family transcriptional regulator [cyanobiont of Ornithocercus magnificus]|nr:CopG family transcriptional regulator [cyanobiont of Ornithocercus magnificus]